jgi:ankyrin repeat protein
VSAKNGHTAVVSYLLSNHDVRKQLQELQVAKGMQYSGATALWVAAEKGRLDILRLLLSPSPPTDAQGIPREIAEAADPHARNIAGATALM